MQNIKEKVMSLSQSQMQYQCEGSRTERTWKLVTCFLNIDRYRVFGSPTEANGGGSKSTKKRR